MARLSSRGPETETQSQDGTAGEYGVGGRQSRVFIGQVEALRAY